MTATHDIETVLLTMDPAHPGELGDGDARAAADLHRILATDPRPTAGWRSATEGRRRFSHLSAGRLVAAGALVAVLVTALIVAPPLVAAAPAFATWTASPEAVTSAEARDAARAAGTRWGRTSMRTSARA